jgi:glucan phosphoethanolaminetransferase (alkaline phosphatase superfamily)
MIQRIQSLFLLAVAVAMVVYLVQPSWLKTNPTTQEAAQLTAYAFTYTKANAVQSSTPTYYLAGLAVLAAVLALASLLQYRNRMRQLLLNLINSLVMAGLLGATGYLSQYRGRALFDPAQQGTFEAGFYAVVLALICNVVANRFIRRDEQLVRSADRMR